MTGNYAVKLNSPGPASWARSDGLTATQADPVIAGIEEDTANGLVETGPFNGPYQEGDDELAGYDADFDTEGEAGGGADETPTATGASEEQLSWVNPDSDEFLTVSDLEEELAALDEDYERGDREYVEILREIDEAERAGKARKGALDVIRERMPEFDGPTQDAGVLNEEEIEDIDEGFEADEGNQ